jgi:hypothetical protein
MDCAEFHKTLPEMVDSGRDVEFDVHLKSCPECSGLVADLESIKQQARELQDSAEPAPRVWNRIEIALKQEGLIREAEPEITLVTRPRRWKLAWLVPVAATALFAGVLGYMRLSAPPQVGERSTPVATPALKVAALPKPKRGRPEMPEMDDKQFMDLVASRSAPVRARYEADLKRVNDSIRDAESSVDTDPGDEMAQQYLMDAYQQKAVVYQLAMDRTSP